MTNNPVKGRMFRKGFLAAAAGVLFFASALVTSCEHKELWYGSDLYRYVSVVFDWSRIKEDPDVSVVDMHLFYRDTAKTPLLEQKPKAGGDLRAPYGDYRVFAYNNDTGALLDRNADSFDTFELYTRDENILAPMGVSTKTDLRAKGAQDQRVVLSPEKVWSGRDTLFDVVLTDGPLVKTIVMGTASHRVVVEIAGVLNFKYLSSISCALSGLAEGYLPGPDVITDVPVTIPFSGLKMDAKSVEAMRKALAAGSFSPSATGDAKDSVFGELYYFGHCPLEPKTHWLTVYAVLTSGEKYMYTFDVTPQMHAPGAEVDGTIHILIEDLPLPVPISDGSGMTLSMDDWEGEYIEINMGGNRKK